MHTMTNKNTTTSFKDKTSLKGKETAERVPLPVVGDPV